MPCSAISPRRANAVVNLAPAAAKRWSQYSAYTRPSPAQAPLMAAMIGLGTAGKYECASGSRDWTAHRRARRWPPRPAPRRRVGTDRAQAVHVGTGAEAPPRTGEHDHAHAGVVGGAAHRRAQRLAQAGGVGIQPVGAVQRDRGDALRRPSYSTSLLLMIAQPIFDHTLHDRRAVHEGAHRAPQGLEVRGAAVRGQRLFVGITLDEDEGVRRVALVQRVQQAAGFVGAHGGDQLQRSGLEVGFVPALALRVAMMLWIMGASRWWCADGNLQSQRSAMKCCMLTASPGSRKPRTRCSSSWSASVARERWCR